MTSTAGREEQIGVQGMNLQVFRGGTGPDLLVLHDCEGMIGWHPYHAELGSHFSVIAPSHPGFGASERSTAIDSIEDVVYLYLDFLEVLGLQSVDVLGLGLGGWIAAEMAVRCGHLVRSLVLVDTVGIKTSLPTQTDVVDTFIMNQEQLLEVSWHDPALGAQVMKLPDTPGLAYDEVVALAKNRETATQFTWKPFMHNPKLLQRLHRISAPSLVIWGEDDRIVSPDYGRSFQQAIPNARFETIARAGHYPYLERPQELVSAVTSFLLRPQGE